MSKEQSLECWAAEGSVVRSLRKEPAPEQNGISEDLGKSGLHVKNSRNSVSDGKSVIDARSGNDERSI